MLEVILAMALFSIVSSIVAVFFMSSSNELSNTSVRSELQENAQHAFDFFNKAAMESQGIDEINDGVSLLGSTSTVDVTAIKLKGYNSTDNEFRISNGALLYNNSVICNNTKKINIKPIGLAGTDFQNSKGIYISITFSKNRIEYSIDNNVFYRNKQ